MLLIAFIDGESYERLCPAFADRYGFRSQEVRKAVTLLKKVGLLVSPRNKSHMLIQRLCSAWGRYGWIDAADYHISTLNYPFVNYAADGQMVDHDRMRKYVSEAKDTNRSKKYGKALVRLAVPTTSAVLDGLDVSFSEVWSKPGKLRPLNKSSCSDLVSAVFGKLRSRRLSDNRRVVADAIRKTSPSGGSRHPTECYVFSRRVGGLPRGAYHFNVADSTLDLIDSFAASDDEIQAMFSGPLRAKFEVQALIIFTSVFERSMYRYREPRSFRAIYMDLGHLLGTLDLVAKGLGLNCLVQHGISQKLISPKLRINPLFEGVLYGAAIGGATEADAIERS